MTVTVRSSTLTNAFINAIVPVVKPTNAEEREAIQILGIDPSDIRCTYCGDPSTERDHLRPIITNQEPTGFITEIANLVPSCGKCNQSKGQIQLADLDDERRTFVAAKPERLGFTIPCGAPRAI